MNFQLPHIPNRPEKPRENGLTMIMDKGLSLSQADSLIESSGKYIDIIKLGFGTSLVTNKVQEKIKKYQNADIIVYLGGTLFEAFIIRDMYNDYKNLIEKWNITHCEVSDGSISINNQEKHEFIMDLSKKYTVLSEIGYKDDRKLRPEEWSKLMNEEIEAGSWKVIAEARESGNTGIFRHIIKYLMPDAITGGKEFEAISKSLLPIRRTARIEPRRSASAIGSTPGSSRVLPKVSTPASASS